ncbi:RES domain-containing protein [Mesorhizobium sp. B2-3-12]|uniref:RES family NAD+ phosphorylase n=1 Tax=Mesorhizobium sp. B2-3-12 TaxID=2589952 RepID=UPI00112AE14D|nr:RES domain-containing protein [Mesorhizobium sp. B2-3-12]TPL78805.1 RES domain-containing protein [Mesorhizobium sp. B2-3-12]
MTPLPGSLGTGAVFGWRLDHERFRSTWDSGEGAFKLGARWNSKGVRAVYASVDPSTAILEVAVHKGFRTLDTVPHILTSFEVSDPASIQVATIEDVPNPAWLRPGIPSAGQQQFGDSLLASHPFVLLPSTVSLHSWNLIFDPGAATGLYEMRLQEHFALDTRLHPPAA